MAASTGDMIRKYRIEKGLTQKQLGELCGIADSNIRKYEKGIQNPKIENLQKIASALDVSVFDLRSPHLPSIEEIKEKMREWTGNEKEHDDIVINHNLGGLPDRLNNYTRELGEFLYSNPKHKELFDSSMEVKPEDVDFARKMLDRINGKFEHDDPPAE